jgi:hypothetical protein
MAAARDQFPAGFGMLSGHLGSLTQHCPVLRCGVLFQLLWTAARTEAGASMGLCRPTRESHTRGRGLAWFNFLPLCRRTPSC